MKPLARQDLPNDYHYYRSHSETYFSWITKNAAKNETVTVFEDGFYGFVKTLFWKWFQVAHFEKCDFEPYLKTLVSYDFHHGLVMWSPWKKNAPEGNGWWKLPSIVSYWYHHSTRSAFSILDGAEYWKKWSAGPRGHRNAIRKWLHSGKIRIDTEASLEDFLSAYEKTILPHGWKRYLIARQKFLSSLNDGNIRIYLAFVGDEALAGVVLLDDAPTSTYLIAFQDQKARPYHLGLALVDKWFEESLTKGFKYLDLDHMRDRFDPASYTGYTEFKSGIADYDVRFHDVWMKFF